MSGARIKLYTDEDVKADLALQLSRQGYDILSCVAAGNAHQGLSDEWQLKYAATQGRAIMVHNVSDYALLDRAWKREGLEHFGIIFAEKRTSIRDLVRRTKLHLDTYTPEYQFNLALFLVP